MIIQRPRYMEKLIRGMGSGQVKIVTGVRRCGKSFLLFDLFKSHLVGQGVPESNIFEMAFDRFSSRKYRNPEVFYPYLAERLGDVAGARYVLLDEVQLLGDFAEVLIDLIAMEGVRCLRDRQQRQAALQRRRDGVPRPRAGDSDGPFKLLRIHERLRWRQVRRLPRVRHLRGVCRESSREKLPRRKRIT